MSKTQLELTTEVKGLLPAANGGTGAGTLTGLVVGNGTSAMTVVTAPSGTVVGTTDAQVVTNKTLLDTFMGAVFETQKIQRDTTLTASTDFVALDMLEVNASYSLEIPSTSSLEILTYQRLPRPTVSTVPGATATVNTDLYDTYSFIYMGAGLTLTLSGNPRLGQKLMLGFKDDGTARAITWPSNTVSSGVATLLATTVISKQHWVGLMYDGTRWACLAVDSTGY